MIETPNSRLPYILPAQAQKHVTHNEAIPRLDALAQPAVSDRDLRSPPTNPVQGARFIVGPSPSAVSSRLARHVAAWQDGPWAFYMPVEGWLAWDVDESTLVGWDGANWVAAGGGGASAMLNLATGGLFGINATADTTKRLAVKSPASLFDNAGAGHQQKLNKATAGDTA